MTPRSHTTSILDVLHMHGNKEINFPMDPAPCLNSARVNGNHRNNVTAKIYQGAASPSFGLLVHVLCRAKWPKRWTNCLLHCNCDVESFFYESGSPFLFFTTVAISPFDPSLNPVLFFASHTSAISDCVYPFLLVFFDSLAEKAFLARSMKL